jgi:hypothetical protein
MHDRRTVMHAALTMWRAENHALYLKLLADARLRGIVVKTLIVDIACRLRLHVKKQWSHVGWLLRIFLTVGMWHVLVPRVRAPGLHSGLRRAL